MKKTKPEYAWDGDWEDPGNGQYVIFKNGREMEPAEVIDILDKYEDLLEQLKARVTR